MMSTLFGVTVQPLYLLARSVVNRALDRRAGLRTEAEIRLEALGLAGQHRNPYQATGWYELQRVLKRDEVAPDDVFLDIGSGMGRAVYQAAAWYRFRRVVGLELSPRLNEIARQNIARTRERLVCKDVELVTGDVLDFEVPDDVTVVYLNNPFTGPVFRAAVEKLSASLERRPRTLRVVYSHPDPESEQALRDAGFRQVRSLRPVIPRPGWRDPQRLKLFVAGPGDGGA